MRWLFFKLLHYYSTGCLHGEHTTCREKCGYCGKLCRCWCHKPQRTTEIHGYA